jgi:threonine dehydrogenase-like Zn-dependent dehydrogenase
MKAAVYYGKEDIRIEELDRPMAGDHGMVMRVRAAGICGSDLHYYKDLHHYTSVSPLCKPGVVLGHENCGDVVEVGAKVKDLEEGDRVFAVGYLPCFECEMCKKEAYTKCRDRKGSTGYGLNGGFAEYVWVPVVMPNRNVFKLTETMSYQDGSLIEPVAVGAQVVKFTEPQLEDVAVVLGAGMIGLGAVATFKALAVSKIIVSDISDRRLQAAKELGADLIINAAKENVEKLIMEETSGRGADIVIEAAGQPVTFSQSLNVVRREGKVGLVAAFEELCEFSPDTIRRKRLRIIPSLGNDFPAGYQIVKAGGVKDSQVVSHAFPLEKIKRAFEIAIDTRESIKVMIEP